MCELALLALVGIKTNERELNRLTDLEPLLTLKPNITPDIPGVLPVARNSTHRTEQFSM
jgi:hypothetical protein